MSFNLINAVNIIFNVNKSIEEKQQMLKEILALSAIGDKAKEQLFALPIDHGLDQLNLVLHVIRAIQPKGKKQFLSSDFFINEEFEDEENSPFAEIVFEEVYGEPKIKKLGDIERESLLKIIGAIALKDFKIQKNDQRVRSLIGFKKGEKIKKGEYFLFTQITEGKDIVPRKFMGEFYCPHCGTVLDNEWSKCQCRY
jgi:predicted RNA-binding Zn-ribbon protein involved in translation (DUF1610 family)